MKKSIIFLSCLLMTAFLTTTFAFDYPNLTPDEAVKQFMLDRQGPNDPWEGQDPKVAGKQFFYSASDETPSYIEYKVSCNDTRDCGSILVNLDNTTDTITTASFRGLAMFESIGLTKEESLGEVALPLERLIPDPDVKYYYFTPFDVFSFNESNGEIKVYNPYEKYLEQEHKQALLSKKNDSQLVQMFNGFRELAAKTLVERVDKQINKRLQQTSMSRAIRSTYVGSGINQGNCRSYTPCYTQGRRTYPGHTGTHWTGCTPTAFSIIMGFYDRMNFPNILEGALAPVINNQDIVEMQTEIGDLLGTMLGGTNPNNSQEGWKYLDGKYSYSSNYHTWWMTTRIRTHINGGRPVILHLTYRRPGQSNTVGHAVVAHGYQGDDRFFVNFGWQPQDANREIVINGDTFEGNGLTGNVTRIDVATLSNN